MSLRRRVHRWRFMHAAKLPRGPQAAATTGFVFTFLGAVGFGWVYAVDGDTQLLGLSLFVALAGLAYGFAAWATLLPQGPYVEERESMQPPEPQRQTVAEDLAEADRAIVSAPVPRRAMTLGLGALGIVVLFPLRSMLVRGSNPAGSLARTSWRPGSIVVLHDGTPVSPDDLDVGTALTVYPSGHTDVSDSAVMLVRVPPEVLQLSPERMAWTVDGIVGYSKICTHAGCPVGQFIEGTGELMCPCHQSTFDVLRAAQPRYGPASRALPQLPLAVNTAGQLVALDGFAEPIGPSYWRTT